MMIYGVSIYMVATFKRTGLTGLKGGPPDTYVVT